MDERNTKLKTRVKSLYDNSKEKLLFHGWHHIEFVAGKAVEFAEYNGADKLIVEAAALVHDLNYMVEPNSEPEVAKDMRSEILVEFNFTKEEIDEIESLVMKSHTATRGDKLNPEAEALSDADTLFKSLPITPVIFASKYIEENKVDIKKLAEKVTSEQNPLMEKDIYFYTEHAKKKYLHWAKTNLELWNNIKDSLDDPDLIKLLDNARSGGVL